MASGQADNDFQMDSAAQQEPESKFEKRIAW